jgi:hypothetical protein
MCANNGKMMFQYCRTRYEFEKYKAIAEAGEMKYGVAVDEEGREFGALHDSGEREEFPTGSVRDTRKGKGRFDLLMAGCPDALFRLARHFENGADKYGDYNCNKGQPLMRYIDSGVRHLTEYTRGDFNEDHLAAAIWNLMLHAQTLEQVDLGELPASLDDRPAWMRHE